MLCYLSHIVQDEKNCQQVNNKDGGKHENPVPVRKTQLSEDLQIQPWSLSHPQPKSLVLVQQVEVCEYQEQNGGSDDRLNDLWNQQLADCGCARVIDQFRKAVLIIERRMTDSDLFLCRCCCPCLVFDNKIKEPPHKSYRGRVLYSYH